MTFHDQLKAHIGCLIYVTNKFYWYSLNSWDDVKERVCMLLDFVSDDQVASADWKKIAVEADATPSRPGVDYDDDQDTTCDIAALLLVDGAPKWIWISKNVIKFIE